MQLHSKAALPYNSTQVCAYAEVYILSVILRQADCARVEGRAADRPGRTETDAFEEESERLKR